MLRILAVVIAEPGLNPLELAERAGVSERTLRRDLTQLRELGYEVASTSGYEVQENRNPDGRPKRKQKSPYDQQLELLQAVAQAVGSAGLGGDGVGRTRTRATSAKPLSPETCPIVLISRRAADANLSYATGFAVETGLYIRFAA